MSTEEIKATVEQMEADGKPYVIATVVRTVAPTSARPGDTAVVDENGIVAGWVGGGCAKPAVTRTAVEALADGQTRLVRISRDLDRLESGIVGYPMTCQSGGTLDIFIEPVMPKPWLAVIGQTAIAEALCALAADAGYKVAVAAPGGRREKFPGASAWMENLDDVAALERQPAAIVVATQGSGDARGLEAALQAKAAYIGFIASPEKGARLKETLKKRGYEAAAVDRIEAPAGLYIGAETPQEVAVSVLAGLVQRRRLGTETQHAAHHDADAGATAHSCCASHPPAEIGGQ